MLLAMTKRWLLLRRYVPGNDNRWLEFVIERQQLEVFELDR